MGKATRGRPRKAGERDRNGRLKPANDKGSDKLQTLASIFTALNPSLGPAHVGCCIGKAHAAGLLDGYGADPDHMRDAAREFAQIRPRYFSTTGIRIAAYEHRSRGNAEVVGTDIASASGLERRYHQFMTLIASCTSTEQDAFFSFACDYFDHDHELAPFVLRLINEARLRAGERLINYDGSMGSGPLPNRADRERMDRAAVVMVAMVEGTQRNRRAA